MNKFGSMKAVKAIIVPLPALAWSFCFFIGNAAAADHFVAWNGTSAGSGSISSPWDLQTALSQPATVQPGDTIWVRGGTYHAPTSNGFSSYLNGTASSPIIVRNYNAERATMDGFGTEFVLGVYGSYTWFWGLEIMDSNTKRTSTTPGSGAEPNAFGVAVYGPGNRFINLIVHDTAEGFSAYDQSPNSEFYGNLSYYNGWRGPDRNHGHGMYMQNASGTKLISDNIVGDNADEGLQVYGSGNASIIGFTVTGNSLYNTSSWPSPNYQYNLVLGGGSIQSGNTISNNYSFFTLARNYGFINLGQYSSGDNLVAINNVFVGGYVSVAVEGMAGPVTFTGNRVYNTSASARLVTFGLFSGQTTSGFVWDNNSYYGLDRFYAGIYNGSSTSGGVSTTLPGWTSETGFDSHSTYADGTPTSNWIYVRPNKYEAKRANITIYNWTLSSTVAVDLSSVLTPGDTYVIQDAQNFYGPPVAGGTYSGGTIAIPMTGLTKATPVGFATPAHTAPQFGTFVVVVPGASGQTPPTQPAAGSPSIITTSLTSGQVSVVYSSPLAATGGTPPYTWSADGLPSGLTVSGSAIVGTPLQSGPASILLTVKDSASASASSTIPLTIAAVTSSSGSSSTSFVGSDLSTQGNWHGVYGGDGFSVANDSQSIPGYATFAIQNQQAWTWDPNPTETRDLQRGSGAGHIAAAWYSSSSLSFDVNFADGKSHEFVLYALDWENAGRAETIQIVDAATGAALDTRSISNFSAGVYLIWNISGHVKVNVARTAGNNAVVSGVFWGGSRVKISVSLSPSSASLSSAQKQQFSATVFNSTNQSVTWSINPTGMGSVSAAGLFTAPASVSSSQTVTVTATSVASPTSSVTAIINLIPPSPPGSGNQSTGSSSTGGSGVASGSGFITSLALGTLRNTYSGWVGMAIAVGNAPITVTSLGRMVAPGNIGTHSLKIVNAASGADVLGSMTSVNTSGAPSGSFLYGALAASVTLNANTNYYILTQETSGGDQWYDLNTTLQNNPAATITGPGYSSGTSYITATGYPGHSYGPVDFRSTSSVPFVNSVTPGTARNDFSGWVGVSIMTGANAVTVTHLGRWSLAGNTGVHTVKIVSGPSGVDVAGGSVAVNVSGAQPGAFVYATLTNPVTLSANSNYYIVSQEMQGADTWNNWNTTVTTSKAASDSASVWSSDGSSYTAVPSSSNHMYVPVGFLYVGQ